MPITQETQKHEASYVIIPKDEYDSMQATIEVLSDKELMEQIKKSEEAIKEGKVRKWDTFVKEKLKK